ncbi:pilus assembly protein PilY [Rhodoferax lacus]|uniref:Pilus assembly protein PilY n=1 Tax=Rhodoferax lacus TaxID=2184758 RepID=A0A3E1RI27_9BURK|nr:PilC/PilY family type IV pilus protein [Rhodoferax lacus]RFO98893.1 pilus assembly protein PilY [Rhodoferax lacus]
MFTMYTPRVLRLAMLLLPIAACQLPRVEAAVISDDFTQAADANDWSALSYACLTAGTSSNNSSSNSKIPGCNMSSPDAVGSGALRLTPASGNQRGAIVSNYTFPTNQGLQVTFSTYTFGGDRGGTGGLGADGISFFLMDGSVGTTLVSGTSTISNIGAVGGSLSYSCSNGNAPYNGLTGAYLGLGMDEYGNFLNSGDNTSTGIPAQTASGGANGYNSWGSGTYQSNRIGLRGAGNVSWYWLNQNYSSLYPASAGSSNRQSAVRSTCSTGLLQNGSSGTYSAASTALSWAGNVLTITSTAASVVRVGDTVVIGSSSGSNPPKVNGTSIVGSYVVTGVGTGTFTVALPNTAGTIANPTNASISIAVQNYAVIPGGYWVLPQSQPIANENTSSRAQATPITYKLMITPAGGLNFMYSYNGGAYQQVLTNWPITASNGPLPASFRFGFAAATGGSTNNHDISCFLAEPVESASGAGANTVQAGQVKTGTQVYTASYNPNFWTGSVMSQPIVTSSSAVSVGTPTWDGNCVLTGGACATTGVAITSSKLLGPSSRKLLTWDGSSGVSFQWDSLSTDQKAVLNSTDTGGQNRLDWLRGGRSNEQTATPPGLLRARAGVLGDVVNSSPTWVGPPSLNYGSSISDLLYASTGSESSHTTFKSDLAQRLNVVYTGSNDGILHGFRSGRNNADGSYSSTLNDGREVIGFVPASTLATTNVVKLTSPTYGHYYFADAAPGFGDVYYDGAWHTWLVSGLGAGGQEIFVLDVTDPEGTATGTTAFSEANAASLVKGDWTPTTLTSCVNASTACGDNLGYTYGTPIVRRLHNGQWAIIFGNGYASTNQRAGVFVGLINASTGAVTFTWLDTGSGSSTSPNGIAYVSSADLDGDHVSDYLYAGDLLGQVWRFDLTSNDPADWAVSTFGQPTATPLYSAGSTHPITTQVVPTVVALPRLGQRVLLGVGTGRANPFTATSATTYASGTQSVYGLWDWDMVAWNNGRTTAAGVSIPASTVKFASLPQITTSPYRTFSKTDLLADSLTSTNGQTRTAAVSTVCWQGSASIAGCSAYNKYGWYFDFPVSGEQLIYNPVFQGGALFVNTVIPPGTAVAGQCRAATPTGWTMAFNMASGGGFVQNAFPDLTGSFVVGSANASIVGIMQSGVGKPYIVTVGSQQYVVNQTIGGNPTITKINPQGGVTVRRVSWEQIR